MQNVLVIRFGSLGDLCLLGASLARLADESGSAGRRVTLVTKAAFAPLMAEMRGVDRVMPLSGSGPGAVAKLALTLRRETWDTVIDAHGVLRAHLLLTLLGRRPDTRLAKDTAARLALLRSGRRDPALAKTMRDRFDSLFPAMGSGNPVGGELPATPPLASLNPEDTVGAVPVGLAPGAQWETKRWPEERFAAVLSRLADVGCPIRIFLGPREEDWYPASALAAAAAHHAAEVIRDRSLIEVAALLAGCRALLTNDSGLLHMSEAVGTPVVACFGPTVREFGYFPALPHSRVIEQELDCRPCSRNGKAPCHRGDLACLTRITDDDVWAALAPLVGLDTGDRP